MTPVRKALCLGMFVFAVATTSAPPTSADDLSPQGTVERLVDAIRSYKDGKNTALSATDQANNARAAKMANSSLAIKEVSKAALGPQWEKLNAEQQAAFVALVTDLFEKIAYPKSSTFFGDLKIEYKGDRVSGDDGVVGTVVRHPREGIVAIDYKLRRAGGTWVIYDIVLDEVSLATDLRTQIQKVLREESYARLIERMRDKLKESS